MITGASITRRGTRGRLREPPLPPLLPFPLRPRDGGADATPSLPCLPLGVRDRQVSTEPAEDIQHLLLLPLLLLLLLPLKGLLDEEPEGGVVDSVTPSHRRHLEERTRGSHVTDRDCSSLRLRLRQGRAPVALTVFCARRPSCSPLGSLPEPSRRSSAHVWPMSGAVAPAASSRHQRRVHHPWRPPRFS